MSSNEEILDANLNPALKNKRGILKLLILSSATVILFLFIITFENYINPESWKNNNEPSMVSIIIVLILFLLNSIQAPKYVNLYDPKLSKLKIVTYSGLNLFLVTMLFMLFQSLIIYGKRGADLPISIVTTPFMIAPLGIPISNLRIHLLRKSKLLWSVILFLILWAFVIVFYNIKLLWSLYFQSYTLASSDFR